MPAAPSAHQDTTILAALIAQVPGAALVGYDETGKVTLFDPGAERLFDYKAHHVVGQSTWELLHESEEFAAAFSFPASHQNWRARTVDVNVLTRSRETIPMRATVMPVAEAPGGPVKFLVLYQDESRHAKAQQELEALKESVAVGNRQSEREADFLRELLKHTIETVQIGLAVLDVASGMIAYVNEGFELITGFKKLQVLSATFEDVLKPWPGASRHLLCYLGKLRACAGTGAPAPPPRHWEVDLPSGKRNIEVYGRPIAVEGHERQYILLIIEDNTQRQRLQMQLVQSEKLAAVGQLAAGIAHEIRNPLNTIYNALFDLSEILPRKSKEVAEDIDISMEEIKRVQEIINNLLDFARESERFTGHANLNDVVQKTIRLVQHDLSNKAITVHCELGEIPEVAMNNNAIKQILINLITNAAQAMAKGGTLTVHTARRKGVVPLRSSAPEPPETIDEEASLRLDFDRPLRQRQPTSRLEHVVIDIADTGMGIPADILPNIFNPFFTTKEPGSGTGLGLSVVHSLVQDAGGAISVRSTVGVGSTFTIELPVVSTEATA